MCDFSDIIQCIIFPFQTWLFLRLNGQISVITLFPCWQVTKCASSHSVYFQCTFPTYHVAFGFSSNGESPKSFRPVTHSHFTTHCGPPVRKFFLHWYSLSVFACMCLCVAALKAVGGPPHCRTEGYMCHSQMNSLGETGGVSPLSFMQTSLRDAQNRPVWCCKGQHALYQSATCNQLSVSRTLPE